MSREDITLDIVSTLNDVTDMQHVTRDSFDPNELSNAQFPAAMIVSSREELQDDIYGSGVEVVAVSCVIEAYVKGASLDELRNELIDAIRDKLYEDRHRGGHCISTKVTSVEIDDGSIAPIGGVQMTVQCVYEIGA